MIILFKCDDLPVIFSASPPTKTVLQPRGRSLVVGSGACGFGGINVQVLRWIGSLVGLLGILLMTPDIKPNCIERVKLISYIFKYYYTALHQMAFEIPLPR